MELLTVDNILEVLGFTVGLLYLWWEYHADKKMWFASIVMPAISMWIYFSKGIYADFAINIYYLIIAVYGYIVWTKGNRHRSGAELPAETASRGKGDDTDDSASASEEGHPITHIPPKMLWGCIGVFILLWGVLYLGLNYLTDSTVPIPDAFTTALSIVGMWMLARKYVEQWIAWIAVDAVCTCLYWYKGIPLYSVLYAAYTVIAVFGYRKWKSMAQ